VAEPLNDNTALIQLILGQVQGGSSKTSNSGTKTTNTKSNVTKEGMDKMIQDILSQAGGIADINAGGAKSGVYDDTTKLLLKNDLITRAAGELAKAQAGTTTTVDDNTSQTTTKESPLSQTDLGSILKGGGIAALLPLLSGGIKGVTGNTGNPTGNVLGDIGQSVGSGLSGIIKQFLGTDIDSQAQAELGEWWDQWNSPQGAGGGDINWESLWETGYEEQSPVYGTDEGE